MRPLCISKRFKYGLVAMLDVAGLQGKTGVSAVQQDVPACHGATLAAAGGFVGPHLYVRTLNDEPVAGAD